MRIIGIADRFIGDRRGTVVVMTAVIVPVLLVAMLGATTLMTALGKRQHLQSIAQAACSRAIKPLRMTTMSDAMRKTRAEALFDELAKDRGLAITSRSVTASWLESRVVAKATVPVMTGFGRQMAVNIAADELCAGVPPYPALGDVILSSNFKTPSGTSVDLTYDGGWGVFTPQQVGWDGGTGPGVEIQDWKNGFRLDGVTLSLLPPGVTNPYVVELDSGPLPGQAPNTVSSTCGIKRPGYNSSIYKNFELHTGTYRFSIWYRGRHPTNLDATNAVTVSLEGTKPVLPISQIIDMSTGSSSVWRYYSYDYTVGSYGLYRVHLAGAGCSDSYGGLFNDFKITYIKRPYPEYNDPTPPLPTN